MRRQCPRDQTPLVEQRAGRVNIDACPQCRGTFLDGIELRRVLGDEQLAMTLADRRGMPPEARACVACSAPTYLDVVEGIELDHCDQCLGVWLDAGELERLASRKLSAMAKRMTLDAVLRDVAAGMHGSTP